MCYFYDFSWPGYVLLYVFLSCYVPCSVSPLSLPAVQGCSVRGHVLEVFLGPEDASPGDTEKRLIDVTGLSPGALIITRIISRGSHYY